MQKSSIAKYGLSVALFILLAALTFVPSQFPAQSQGSFTPTPIIPPPPQTIESDNKILVNQTGLWNLQTALQASGGAYIYSNSTDDVLIFTFIGTSISIKYIESPALGIFAIDIDNTVVRTVISTSTSINFGVETVVDYLETGPHVLRVYPVQGVIGIDAFYGIPETGGMTIYPVSTPSPSEGGEAQGSSPTVSFTADAVPTFGCASDAAARVQLETIVVYKEATGLPQLQSYIDEANHAQPRRPFVICIIGNGQPFTVGEPVIIESEVYIYNGSDQPIIFSGGNVARVSFSDRYYYSGTMGFTVDESSSASQPGLNSMFIVRRSGQVEFSHIQFQNGSSQSGGAIYNNGQLRIYDSIFSGNHSSNTGGAIHNYGSLQITRTEFTNNINTPDWSHYLSGGGAIYNAVGGQITGYCLDIRGNQATDSGGGISNGRMGSGSHVDIHYSTFENNQAPATIASSWSGISTDDIDGGWGNEAIITVDATNNRWINGPVITPNVNASNPLGYIPTETDPNDPNGFYRYVGCTPMGRPIYQTPPLSLDVALQVSEGGATDGLFTPVRDQVVTTISIQNIGQSSVTITRVTLEWQWNLKYRDHELWNGIDLPFGKFPLGFIDYNGGAYGSGCDLTSSCGVTPPISQICGTASSNEGCAFRFWNSTWTAPAGGTFPIEVHPQFNLNHSGEIRFRVFVETSLGQSVLYEDGQGCTGCTFVVPVTHMFDDPTTVEGIKALIFWVVWVETSAGQFEIPPSGVTLGISTSFLRTSPQCVGGGADLNTSAAQNQALSENPNLFTDPELDFRYIYHCSPVTNQIIGNNQFDRDFVYLYALTVLEGMLHEERNSSKQSAIDFDGWVLLSTANFPYTLTREQGLGGIDNACNLQYNNSSRASRLDHHVQMLQCILQPSQNPVISSAYLAYQYYYDFIDAAVDRFALEANNPDSTYYPLGGAVFVKHANVGGTSVGVVVGGLAGTPPNQAYIISNPLTITQQQIENAYDGRNFPPAHDNNSQNSNNLILKLQTIARADWITVLRPSLRLERNMVGQLAGFKWDAWAFQLTDMSQTNYLAINIPH